MTIFLLGVVWCCGCFFVEEEDGEDVSVCCGGVGDCNKQMI